MVVEEDDINDMEALISYIEIQKLFKIFWYIEYCGTYMDH